jgi:hypothetical protein
MSKILEVQPNFPRNYFQPTEIAHNTFALLLQAAMAQKLREKIIAHNEQIMF